MVKTQSRAQQIAARGAVALLCTLALTSSVWAWGAIAVDDEAGTHPDDVGYGFSTGHNSEAAARSGALAECRKQGNSDCKVILTFRKCGAYATSHRYYGVAQGSSATEAQREAIAGCGQSSCKVVVVECD